MDKYDKYLQRIRVLLENLNSLRNHDTINCRLNNFEQEMDEMLDSMGKQIDDQMSRNFHSKNVMRNRKAS